MSKLKITLLFLRLCLCCCGGGLALSQDDNETDPIEVLQCTKYKKDIYEEEQPFQLLVHGAPEMKDIADNCKPSKPFVVNGTPANPKEFPLMAALGHAAKGNETKWFCGGTLISEKFVLTAAHCFDSK